MTSAHAGGTSVGTGLMIRRPRSATELWDAAIVLGRAHFGPLLVLSALMLLLGSPAMLARTFLFEPSENGTLDFFASLYEFAVGSVIGGAMTVVAADAWHERPVDVAQAGRQAMRRAPALMVAGAVTGLLVLVLMIFLVVPGLLAAARLFAVGTVIVLEGRRIGDAFRRSVRLSRGNMRRLLATVGVATLVTFVLAFSIELYLERLGFAKPMAALLTGVSMMPMMPFLLTLSVVTYFDVRVRQEAYDLEVAVDALD